MDRRFEPIPVDEEFCVLLEILLNEPCNHEDNCSRTGGKPNYIEIYRLKELSKLIESDRSHYSLPLPENMDHDDWMRFLRRMDDAAETYRLHVQTYHALIFLVHLSSLFPVIAPLLIGWCDNDTKIQGKCSEEPPLWWIMLVGVLFYSWYFSFEVPVTFIVNKILMAPKIIWRKSQEKVVKDMQFAFKCSGYSAEFVVAPCCGVTSNCRYVRFTPISESEKEHLNSLNKDFKNVYNSQKEEAKNKPYDPSSWKPLEGQWEEKNRFGLGKVTHRWIFNTTESANLFHSQYECNFHTIACAFIPNRKLSYHLEGNLLISVDETQTVTEIFRLNGNDDSVAFYRVGSSQIWKVEGSTCMQFNFEGDLVSENDMISTNFWSTAKATNVYRKVTKN